MDVWTPGCVKDGDETTVVSPMFADQVSVSLRLCDKWVSFR